MALVTMNLAMNQVGNEIVLIENPGVTHEKILYRYDPTDVIARKVFFHDIQEDTSLPQGHKDIIYFYMGYFHAHMGSR